MTIKGALEVGGVACLCPKARLPASSWKLAPSKVVLLVSCLVLSLSCEQLVEAHGKGLTYDYELLTYLGLPAILNGYRSPYSIFRDASNFSCFLFIHIDGGHFFLTLSAKDRTCFKTFELCIPTATHTQKVPAFSFSLRSINYIVSLGQRWEGSCVLSLLRRASHSLDSVHFTASQP